MLGHPHIAGHHKSIAQQQYRFQFALEDRICRRVAEQRLPAIVTEG
jgi:hypothetical protein